MQKEEHPAVLAPSDLHPDSQPARSAVADKATVPIYYESRVAKLRLNQSELPKIDEEFEAITEGEAEAQGKAQDDLGRARSTRRESEADRSRRRRSGEALRAPPRSDGRQE